VGTIHGTNTKPPSKDQGTEKAAVVEIVDDEDDVSVLTTKTQDKLFALLLQERQKSVLDSGFQSLTIHGVRGIRRRVRA
jgi:hypothetical protein